MLLGGGASGAIGMLLLYDGTRFGCSTAERFDALEAGRTGCKLICGCSPILGEAFGAPFAFEGAITVCGGSLNGSKGSYTLDALEAGLEGGGLSKAAKKSSSPLLTLTGATGALGWPEAFLSFAEEVEPKLRKPPEETVPTSSSSNGSSTSTPPELRKSTSFALSHPSAFASSVGWEGAKPGDGVGVGTLAAEGSESVEADAAWREKRPKKRETPDVAG